MSLFGRPWALHDVADVERFCIRVLRSTSAANLSGAELEDTLAYLIAECWILSERFDTTVNPSFSSFAYRTLRLPVVDAARRKFRTRWVFRERVYERPKPEFLSLDADDSERGRLDEIVATRTGDPQNDRHPDLTRLLAGGDRQLARDLAELGLEPPGRAA